MMGYWGSGYGGWDTGFGFWSLLAFVTWLALVVFLILGSVYFWKKIMWLKESKKGK